MAHRFLAFILFGMLALAAFDGFERRGQLSASPSSGAAEDGQVSATDGGNPWPIPKKF